MYIDADYNRHMKTVQTLIKEIYEVVKDEYLIAKMLTAEGGKQINQGSVNRWKHGYNQAVAYDKYLLIEKLHKKICGK